VETGDGILEVLVPDLIVGTCLGDAEDEARDISEQHPGARVYLFRRLKILKSEVQSILKTREV